MTQFQRAMKQLGVQVINANSPQAKGRVERMNRTLQDRLVNELRLANISDIDSANIFLKEYAVDNKDLRKGRNELVSPLSCWAFCPGLTDKPKPSKRRNCRNYKKQCSSK